MVDKRAIVARAFDEWAAGTTYRNTYAWFMTLDDDGKIVDGTAFYDSISFNELRKTVTPQ